MPRQSHSTVSRAIAVLLWILAGTAGLCTPASASDPPKPNYFDYQVKFPAPPSDGRIAIDTRDLRMQAVLATEACGRELDFASDNVKHEANEGSTARIMAKIEWGGGHSVAGGHLRITEPCKFSRTVLWGDVCAAVFGAGCGDPAKVDDGAVGAAGVADQIWMALQQGTPDTGPLRDKVLSRTHPANCETFNAAPGSNTGTLSNSFITGARVIDPTDKTGRSGSVQIDFEINQPCLLAQAAAALGAMIRPYDASKGMYVEPGTKGDPCYGPFGAVAGDWDMALRDLTRIAFLIKRYHFDSDPQFLGAYQHLRNELLNLDGGPVAESRNVLFSCGNQQNDTGTAQERADNRGFGDDISHPTSFPDWLKYLLLVLLALAALAALALAAASLLGAAVNAALAAAIILAVVAACLNIPETENHLLGMNSAIYLNNQLIIDDLGPGSDAAAPFESDQKDLKAWFFKRMQGFLQKDFIEYNAHPYQRHSIESIRNLRDFAQDPEVRNAAELVLDYTAAKFAIGSNQARRMVPFRRHRSSLTKSMDTDVKGFNGLFDFGGETDHQAALGLLYAGQSQQLPLGQASLSFAEEIIHATTSSYVPPVTILDLAIVKDIPVYQRIHHVTEEIYSSDREFLISAGGTLSGPAYPVTPIEGVDLIFTSKDDWGSGVPTTLFLTGPSTPQLGFLDPALPDSADQDEHDLRVKYNAQQMLGGPGRSPPPVKYLQQLSVPSDIRTTLGEFIRIKGEVRNDNGTDDGKPVVYRAYNHNLCVWDGFACGTNMEIPASACVDFTLRSGWGFADTDTCPAYKDGPRTFIAVLRRDCPSDRDCTNFGFFEVIGAEKFRDLVNSPAVGAGLFDAFMNKVVAANPILVVLPLGSKGFASPRYNSVRGQAIDFDYWGNDDDSDKSGIFSVNGHAISDLGDWPFAGGDSAVPHNVKTPMNSKGTGLVTVHDFLLNKTLTLDFSDRDHPKPPMEN